MGETLKKKFVFWRKIPRLGILKITTLENFIPQPTQPKNLGDFFEKGPPPPLKMGGRVVPQYGGELAFLIVLATEPKKLKNRERFFFAFFENLLDKKKIPGWGGKFSWEWFYHLICKGLRL